MKISEKDKKTLLIFLSILIIACTFFFVYSPLMKKVNAQRDKTVELQTQLDTLKNMEAKKPAIEKKIKELNGEVQDVVKNFPERITTESEIAYILKFMYMTGVTMESVTLAEEEEIYNNGFVAKKYRISFPYKSTYDGIKNAIQYLNNYEQRTSIESLEASYDASTGNLSGDMSINVYSVPDFGTKYEVPDFGDMDIGTDNLFQTFEIKYKK